MKSRELTFLTKHLFVLSFLFLISPVQLPGQDNRHESLANVNQRFSQGKLTRVVCFGDSITGVYYHTGGQRAWCDMLGLVLQKGNPRANLQMINAGISGHTTVNALARIEKDVLAKSPHLVVVMFGMNDVTRVPLDQYRSNILEIIERCEAVGSAVVLCTPNSVSENAARPEEKLATYVEVVREIAAQRKLPLVDIFQDWQTYRDQDSTAWSLIMSDVIHPNMTGHIRFAELMGEVITGRRVAVAPTLSPQDGLQNTFDRLSQGELVKLVAMAPYDELFPKLLRVHFPDATFEVTEWPTAGQSISDQAQWAKQIRGMKPHLVIPAETSVSNPETFIRDFEWVLNFSFQFAGRPWDVVPVLSFDTSDVTDQHAQLARSIVLGKDVQFIERTTTDDRNPEDIVSDWITNQKRIWSGSRNQLPPKNDSLIFPAQPWPFQPGPRSVKISIHYPQGKLENVTQNTGIMLTLHNWGGENCAGTANPNTLANRLNVIAVCVNYLQSGRKASVDSPEPYDFGYLQALDALRALYCVREGLKQSEIPYDDGRLFCTGGSGGGNVTLMANKLAPRTFACIIDMCGMKKLSDDIAYHLPGGSGLNARWSRDPQNINFLSTDAQALRFVGHPKHLDVMKSLQPTSKIIVVHGQDDATCPFPDAQECVQNFRTADLDVESHFISKQDLDGKVFTSSGHALGNRTEIVFRVAGKYLNPQNSEAIRRDGLSDFDRSENITYPTPNGRFVISYANGFPVGSFVANDE